MKFTGGETLKQAARMLAGQDASGAGPAKSTTLVPPLSDLELEMTFIIFKGQQTDLINFFFTVAQKSE